MTVSVAGKGEHKENRTVDGRQLLFIVAYDRNTSHLQFEVRRDQPPSDPCVHRTTGTAVKTDLQLDTSQNTLITQTLDIIS